MAVDPLTAATIIAGLFGSRRPKQSAYELAEANLLNRIAGMYGTYAPGIAAALWGIAQAPEQDPWYRAQMLQAEADVSKYFQGAGRDALMQLSLAGGGTPATSLAARDLLAALAAQRGSSLAAQRIGQLGEMFARRMQALGGLSGLVAPMGGQALAGYGGLAQAERARGEDWRNWLYQLGYTIGLMRYRPAGPLAGGGLAQQALAGGTLGQQALAGYGYGKYGGLFWPKVNF